MANKNNLPKLADLHKSPEEAFKNDELNLLLNQPPHATWIKKHPLAKVKNDQGENVASRYMPIDKVETLLTYIFQQWRVEIKNTCVMFNSICATVRLHYLNPVTQEWSYHDGVGAKSVQLDSGSNAADLSSIKDAAVQMALPSAVSYAIKDAAEHLGTIFGRDLNRRDLVGFSGAYNKESVPGTEAPAQQEQPAAAAKQVEFVL